MEGKIEEIFTFVIYVNRGLGVTRSPVMDDLGSRCFMNLYKDRYKRIMEHIFSNFTF